jgi:hypothetical protein
MFGPFREQLGLKSRRKKTGRIVVRYNYPDGRIVDKEIGVSKFPQLCMGFRWPIPGILAGEPPTDAFVGELVVRCDKAAMAKHATDNQAFRIGRVGPLAFARTLAKIAHVYATARYGADAFEPFLPPLILGETDTAQFLVGRDGSRDPEVQRDLLHDVCRVDARRDNGPAYLGVAIQLFAMIGMPRYHVIVGRRLKEAPASERVGGTKAVNLPRVG